MSYSFNWDCTLPISNIEDIVSINIVPQTKAYDEGDYLSLRGQILIDGEYVTSHGTQETFTEYIPLDITLPNNGRGNEITTDITNFDYDVQDGNNLFLTLNLSLDGYDWESPITLVEEGNHDVEVQAQAPVLFTKEAAVVPVGHEVVAEAPATHKEVVGEPDVLEVIEDDQSDDLDYIDFDEVVLDHKEEAIDPSLATERKEEAVEPTLATERQEEDVEPTLVTERKEALTDKIKQFIHKQPVVVQEPVVEKVAEAPVVEEVVEEVVEAPVVEKIVEEVVEAPVVEEKMIETKKSEPILEKVIEKAKEIVPEVIVEKVTKEVTPTEIIEEAAPIVEEVVEKVVEKVKSKPLAPIPTVTKVEKVEQQPVTAVVEEEEEEILPFPLKTEQVVEEVPVQSKKSDIFEMLYSLEEGEPAVEEVTQVPVVEEEAPAPVVQQAPVVEQVPIVEETFVSQPELIVEDEMSEEPKVSTPISTSSVEDSIANQFLDGESILKVIFVQEEETTITNICTKYNVPEKAIYNLEQLNSPLRCGDRVMINYGKLR